MNRLLLSLVWSCLIVAGAVPAFGDCHDRHLDILLTNDDGFDRPGIRTLRDALVAAGHRVTLAAPSHNYSGTGAALSLFSPIDVQKVGDGMFSIGATPATTVLLGAKVLFPAGRSPDLVVSGTNEGANVGAATPISGTVGAAIAAITLLDPSVPAIALSAALPEKDPLSDANRRHFEDIASFAARLVDALAAPSCGARVLPPRTALSVNYPASSPRDVAGIAFARQGRRQFADISFTEKEPGLYVVVLKPPTGRDDPHSDDELLDKRFVTISVLDGDYSTPADPGSLVARLKSVKP
jgi:5'/3'-nucleotidase SurE